MALSPLAEIYTNSMRQTCTIYKYGGADYTGQPVYGAGTAYPCRVAVRTKCTVDGNGDYVTNTDTTFIVPAGADIQAQDMIDPPLPFEAGAVIREVVTAADFLGRVTHQVVRIQ